MSGWSWVFVGAGGAAGTVLRYAVGRWLSGRGFPATAATLAVNLGGSLVIGILFGLQLPGQNPNLYALTGTGFLGGLTTYSTLNVQKALLFGEKKRRALSRYAGATYLGGWILTGLGIWIGQAIWISA